MSVKKTIMMVLLPFIIFQHLSIESMHLIEEFESDEMLLSSSFECPVNICQANELNKPVKKVLVQNINEKGNSEFYHCLMLKADSVLYNCDKIVEVSNSNGKKENMIPIYSGKTYSVFDIEMLSNLSP